MSLYPAKKLIFNKKHSFYSFFARCEVFLKICWMLEGGKSGFLNSENVGLRGGERGLKIHVFVGRLIVCVALFHNE